MTGVAEGKGDAYDATVLTNEELVAELKRRGEYPLSPQEQRERYADEAEAAVKTIEGVLAGTKESLATAKAEAKRLRAEADEGAEG